MPAQSSSTAPTRLFSFSAHLPPIPPAATTAATADSDEASKSTVSTVGPQPKSEPTHLPLPIQPSPSGARTGPVKTGGRVFVLDYRRWPALMKAAIDVLLNKHHGQRDMLNGCMLTCLWIRSMPI